jgi:hypothetical protein
LFYGIQNAIQIEGKMGNQAYFDGAIIERIKMARVQGPEILDLVAHHCVESILLETYRLSSGDSIKAVQFIGADCF